MDSTKIFCLTLTLYLLINYLVNLTFFSSCFVITLKRISSRRHCLFCYHLPNDYYQTINQKFSSIKKYQNQISLVLNKDSIWKKFIAAILCLLFLLSLFSTLWFTLSIDTRLFDNQFLPEDASSLRTYMQSQIDDFNLGPMIMFIIPQTINYQNDKIQYAMNLLINQCQKEKRINQFKLLWLDHENITTILHGKEELQYRTTPFSQNDLIVSQDLNQTKINASRFYCQLNSIIGKKKKIFNKIYLFFLQGIEKIYVR